MHHVEIVSQSMPNRVFKRLTNKVGNPDSSIKTSVVIIGFLLALLVWGIEFWPDAAQRRCSLMPGFCKPQTAQERQPLQALGRPENVHFKLSPDK
jgi:hypothetical protein